MYRSEAEERKERERGEKEEWRRRRSARDEQRRILSFLALTNERRRLPRAFSARSRFQSINFQSQTTPASVVIALQLPVVLSYSISRTTFCQIIPLCYLDKVTRSRFEKSGKESFCENICTQPGLSIVGLLLRSLANFTLWLPLAPPSHVTFSLLRGCPVSVGFSPTLCLIKMI